MINTKQSQRRDNPVGVTLDDCIQEIGFGRYQFGVFAVLALCGFADGMEVLVLAFLYKPLQDKWKVSDLEMGFLGSLIFLGVFLGSCIGGVFGDRIGRKKVLLASSFLIFIFGAISSLAPNFWTLVLSRMVVGFGLGGVGPAAFSMATELCPQERRGMILVLMGQMFSVGEMVEAGLAAVVMTGSGDTTWRQLLACSSVPALFALLLVWKFVPESVRFLTVSGRTQELHATLADMAKQNGKEAALSRLLAGGQIRDAAAENEGHKSRPMDLFRGDSKATTLMLWFIWFVQSFVYYGLTFILPIAVPIVTGRADATLVSDNVYLTSFLAAAAEMPGAALAAFLTDMPHIGRRRSLGGFMVFGGLCCALTAGGRHDLAIFILGIMLAKCAINGSFSLAWAYSAEVYPTVERTTGLGACSAMSRIGGVATPLLSVYLLKQSFFIPFLMYTVVACLGGITAVMLKVETSGAKLQDTDRAKRDEETVSLIMEGENNDLMPSDMRYTSRISGSHNTSGGGDDTHELA